MKKLIGSISVALTLALSVFGLAACDLVNFNWGTGSDHEHHFTEYEATDPTCTKNGNYRYFKCDVGPDPCGRYYLDLAAMEPVSEESVMIPALGHEYDFDNIVWSEWNGKEITASVTCMQCDEEEPGHVLHPEITVEFTQTKAPTCTAKGEGYYTASFTYEGETYTNPTTKTAEVDMIPHTYNKVPDDGWKWADDHTSVSATFTCTAADCTHKETVTVSGAAITSKVETIKGVCTDGSQTVYTATAEFNGETYDLTDTVVTLEAINEHTAGAWQYDTENHWHKCQNGDHAADEKQPHKVDSATHQCECGYVEESYTVTALTLAANAENTAAILTISGTYTGYDQQGLTELFCEKNTDGNYFFNFWGNRIGRENAKSVTLTKWENGEFSVALDVTDLPVCELRNICRTDLGDQDWKLSTETIEETTITVGEKVYTLQPSNGQGWNNIGLKVSSKTVEKTYAITDASIAAEGEAVYVTVSGTFAGYTKEEFLAALQDDKTGRDELAFCVFYDGTGPSDSKWGRVIPYNSKLIEYDAKEGGTFTVKINVTSLEKNLYKIGKDNGNYADIKNLSCTGTATVGDKKYDLAGDTGGLALVVSDKPDESKARDLTGISLTAEGGRVYLVYTGTFKGYSEGEMTTYLTDEEIFYFWGNGGAHGQKPASRAATFENGKWTLKLDVTDMPDDTEYALCWKDYTGNDLKPPLAGGSDTAQDAGNRTYTLIAKDWNGTVRLKIRTNVSFTVTKGEIAIEGGKTVVTISGTYSNCTKAQFEAVLKDTDETNVGFRVINGGTIIDGKENWDKVAGPTSYEVSDNGTFTVKIDVTELTAGRSYYVNQQKESNTDIKTLTERYEKSVTNGTKTYKLTGTPGENIALNIADAPAPTPVQVTLEFADAYGANNWLFFWVTSEVDISVESGTTVKVNGEAPVSTVCTRNADGRYEFRVQIASNKLAHYEFKWYNEDEECIAEGSWDQEFTVTLTVSGNEDNVAGTVTLKQGEKAVNSGEKIAAQSELTLTVTVNEAYRVEVLVNNNAVELQDDVHTFVLDSNTTIYVNFTKIDAEVVAKELTILSANFYNGNFLTIELSQEDADYVGPYTTVVINNHADTTHFHMRNVNSYQIQVDVADYEQDFTIEWFNSFGQKVAYASYKMTSGPEDPPAEKSATFAGTDLLAEGNGLRINLNVTPKNYSAAEIAAAYIQIGEEQVTRHATYSNDQVWVFILTPETLAKLTEETYDIVLHIGEESYACPSTGMSPANTTQTVGGHTYTLSVDVPASKFTLSISSASVEKKVTGFHDSEVWTNNSDKVTVNFYVDTQGYTADEVKGIKLLINGEELNPGTESEYMIGTGNQNKLWFDITGLGAMSKALLQIKLGEETIDVVVTAGFNTPTQTLNNTTYTLERSETNQLQLTVAAVVPAADGSQDAPFSVSDLAAIFEGDSFNEEGYYTKDGEAQEVYVKGMVKSYDAASKQVTLQQIETRGGVLAVALSASELKIVIGEGTYNGSSTEGMTFVVGDVLTVKGYLQKGEGTLTITGKDGTTPTIEVWESANKDTPALDAESDKAALETFFAALIEEVEGMEDLTKEFVLPLPTRPGVTFAFKVTAGDAAVTITDGKVIKVTRGADAVEVTIEATIKVAGVETDFTVDGSPFTFTVPQTEPETTKIVDLAKYGTAQGWGSSDDDSTNQRSLIVDDNIEITVTVSNSGKNSGKFYSNSEWRLYQSEGAKITFTAKNSATIKTIKIEYTADNSGVLTDSTGATQYKTGTEISVKAESVTFVVDHSSGTKNGIVKIKNITVVYAGGKQLTDEEKVQAALEEIEISKKTLTENLELPETTISGVTLTWTVALAEDDQSGVEDVNTVAKIEENTLMLVGAQKEDVKLTLTVTAKCGEKTQSQTFDLTVAAQVQLTTVSLSFASTAQRNSRTNEQQIWEQNGITFTNKKANSKSNVADYAGPVRCYKGSSITVEYSVAMKKIVFNCNSSSYATALVNSIGTISGVEVEHGSGAKDVIVTFETAQRTFTIASLTDQIRFDSIDVSYTPAN